MKIITLTLNRSEAETLLKKINPKEYSHNMGMLNIKTKIYECARTNQSEWMRSKQTGLVIHSDPKNIETHNTKIINANRTHLQGTIEVSYEDLLCAFGEPNQFSGDKTDWEWIIESGGVVATIYNWKDGPKWGYNRTPKEIKKWNVGGYFPSAMDLVKSVLLINGVKC